jgi:ADP-ribosylglycohydrolase
VRTAGCLGGDADTLACITGAVAEAIHGVPTEMAARARAYLPEDLLAVLDISSDRSLRPR